MHVQMCVALPRMRSAPRVDQFHSIRKYLAVLLNIIVERLLLICEAKKISRSRTLALGVSFVSSVLHAYSDVCKNCLTSLQNFYTISAFFVWDI